MQPEDRLMIDALSSAQTMMIEVGNVIGEKELTDTPYHTNVQKAIRGEGSNLKVIGSETKDWNCFVTY